MEGDSDKVVHISAANASGGEIVMRKRWERTAFIAGLLGSVVLAWILAV